jgi:hypothetical protein
MSLSSVPKLSKISLDKLLKEYFKTDKYGMIATIYKNLNEFKNLSVPIQDWDSLYIEIFVKNDKDFEKFIENKMDDYEFSKKQILKKAEKKFIDASHKYISSTK